MDKNKKSIGKLSRKENKIDSWLTKTALNHLYKEFSKLESLLHNLSQKSLLEKVNFLSNEEIKLKKTSLRKIERGKKCRKFL